ncbi:leucine-rich repeat-containing protein 72-like isoform X2 [Hydractinia symbiolongicarpus]|uniref:leucine-rich repeat-containing protein 72-like isoform X2 n=1 Tax=Hydractinia symbiolongicarpus TaxID=13093 RepID=UPI00254E6B5E|nr:leucine-rich repeat-containing protein 72-like isoform X2 [Hydractinia symbiolongicarpus]
MAAPAWGSCAFLKMLSQLDKAPDMSKFKNLRRLYLNKNKMFLVGEGLRQNFILTELYLQDNMLTTINSALQHLTCLRILLLHHNQLTAVTDVIYELRHMMNLKVLNLFGNPLAQEYDYRDYIIYSVKSMELFDRKAITSDERDKIAKKYDVHEKKIKDTIAFGRRVKGPPPRQQEMLSGHLDNTSDQKNKYDIERLQREVEENKDICSSKNSLENVYAAAVETRAKKRSIMQFKTFSWVDILKDREEACDKGVATDPIIFSAKFR